MKIRSGWDEESVNYREAADAAVEGGAAAVTLHARTRAQGYAGKADWEKIADLVSVWPCRSSARATSRRPATRRG